MPSEKMFQTALVCDAHDNILFSQSESRLRLPCCQQPAALHTTLKKTTQNVIPPCKLTFWDGHHVSDGLPHQGRLKSTRKDKAAK